MLKQRADERNLMDFHVYIVPPFSYELSRPCPVLRFFYNNELQDRAVAKRVAADFVRSHNIAVIEIVQTPRDRAESYHVSAHTYFTIKGKQV